MATREQLSPSERVPNRTAKRRPQSNNRRQVGADEVQVAQEQVDLIGGRCADLKRKLEESNHNIQKLNAQRTNRLQ